MTRALLIALGLILLALLLLYPLARASAHSWYPVECCHDHDCRRVPCEEIAETPTGFVFEGVTFEKSAERPSHDRFCHVCILEAGSSKRGLCLFTLQGT